MTGHINLFELCSIEPTDADIAWREIINRDIVNVARAAGFATSDEIYAASYRAFFAKLTQLDDDLNVSRYLLGNKQPSAADQWLSIILWLFDAAYYSLYKLNDRRLAEFSNLGHYVRDVMTTSDWRSNVDLAGLKRQCILENDVINPKRRIPLGTFELAQPHDRALRFGDAENISDIEENPADKASAGEWKRKRSGHRHTVSAANGSRFVAERGRYHLYIANNCPWCHRTAITRQLKNLDDVVSMDVLFYSRDLERGWQFRPDEPNCTADSLYGYQYIRELYERVGSSETSVPILWDKETQQIVSNESADIVRMFDQAFSEFSGAAATLYPTALTSQIDRVNTFTYHSINNGAYKAGFTDSQSAYETAYRKFFDGLETLDFMLRGRKFLLGDHITEADVRLFPTIFRFDPVYFSRFNLDERRIADIPSLTRWLDTMLAIPAIAAASNLEHCRRGYFGRTGNNIVPLGPN